MCTVGSMFFIALWYPAGGRSESQCALLQPASTIIILIIITSVYDEAPDPGPLGTLCNSTCQWDDDTQCLLGKCGDGFSVMHATSLEHCVVFSNIDQTILNLFPSIVLDYSGS